MTRGIEIAQSAGKQDGFRFFAKSVVFAIPHDADDFPERIVRALRLYRLPIASWPGKKRLAKVSFTMRTRYSFYLG